MKVIVFGGDGFCGWPTALGLSNVGHEVVIVDNLSRRKIDIDLGVESLTPIATIDDRLHAWKEITGKTIRFFQLDIAEEYHLLRELMRNEAPDAIVHFAEQRSAPYSMKTSETKRYTVSNNVNATHNILCAIVDLKLKTHVIHLGTMGVYGYGGQDSAMIPEGYLDVMVPTDGDYVPRRILHPVDPGSVYHLTKTLDQLVFYYYNKNDGVLITDLHQGVVWGTNTDLTALDQRLINRFDYDGDYGTVLNRFLMQAAIGYPLSIHGTGGQKRAFIHIRDTVKCIQIALESPPDKGERVRIFNQMTETYRVRDLAKRVQEMTGAEISYLENPRKEAAENELVVDNKCLLELGLSPTYLDKGLLEEIVDVAKRWRERCDVKRIPCVSLWTSSEGKTTK
ncbi:MAG: NAD-dependent dehydratase [Deltaproteobacteria bacterium RIFOXYD12_FULL_50_9]|nr:MAG: NAD-dependent dehydratase [Deltaproteobacteria bacterium RIFOXYD12_FULL_50_9]